MSVASVARPTTPQLALLVALGALVVAGLDAWLSDRPLVAVLLGALAVDIVRQRAEVSLVDDAEDGPTRRRRAALGAAVGLAMGAAPVLAALALRAASLELLAPSVAGAGMAAALLVARAFRDEVLLRALPLALARANGWSSAGALAFAATVAAAPHLARLAWVPALLATATSLPFAWLWLRRGGFVTALAAHVAWRFALADVANVAGVNVRFASGTVAPLARAAGLPALLAAASALATMAALASFETPTRPRGR